MRSLEMLLRYQILFLKGKIMDADVIIVKLELAATSKDGKQIDILEKAKAKAHGRASGYKIVHKCFHEINFE